MHARRYEIDHILKKAIKINHDKKKFLITSKFVTFSIYFILFSIYKNLFPFVFLFIFPKSC